MAINKFVELVVFVDEKNISEPAILLKGLFYEMVNLHSHALPCLGERAVILFSNANQISDWKYR